MAMKIALVALHAILLVHGFAAPAAALNIGLRDTYAPRQCSSTCESESCSVAPFLRYGKYCGFLYSGCPGEEPCDGLDACCKDHDACIDSKNNNLLDVECSQALLDCITKFRNSGEATFTGNKCSVSEVVNEIYAVIEAALWAGRLIP